MRAREFSTDLFEVKMSPDRLKSWADSEGDSVIMGVEYEMYFPNTDTDNEGYGEADYEADEAAMGIDDVIAFFSHGDDPLGRGQLNRLQAQMQNDYAEWVESLVTDRIDAEEFRSWMVDNHYDDWRKDVIQDLEDEEDQEDQEDQIEAQWDEFVQQEYDRSGRYYEEWTDELRESVYSDNDESDWLDSEGLRYMTDIEREYGLNWPYLAQNTGSGGMKNWAEDLANELGAPVVYGGYQSTARRPGQWNLETDSSLDKPANSGDGGLELISPPEPLPQALRSMQRVIDWAKNAGCYTNSTTGLHMNVSVTDVDYVDYVKLVLFVGDRYVLEQFGRMASGYAKSALDKLTANVDAAIGEAQDTGVYTGKVEIDRAMNIMRQGMMDRAQEFIQSAVGAGKYTSVHVKNTGSGSYIEFRSPGGDWLNGDMSQRLAETAMRFGRAMTIAADPEAERQEYGKKLYKLLTGGKDTGKDDIMRLFARYSAGEIDGDELQRLWAEKVVKSNKANKGSAINPVGDFEIYNRRTGEVKDVLKNVDQATAQYRAKNMPFSSDLDVRPARREQQRRDLAQRIADKPRPQPAADTNIPTTPLDYPIEEPGVGGVGLGGTFTGRWLIVDGETGEILDRIGGIGNVQADANRYARTWAQQNDHQGELYVRPEMS